MKNLIDVARLAIHRLRLAIHFLGLATHLLELAILLIRLAIHPSMVQFGVCVAFLCRLDLEWLRESPLANYMQHAEQTYRQALKAWMPCGREAVLTGQSSCLALIQMPPCWIAKHAPAVCPGSRFPLGKMGAAWGTSHYQILQEGPAYTAQEQQPESF